MRDIREEESDSLLAKAAPAIVSTRGPTMAGLLSAARTWFDSWAYSRFPIHEVCKKADYAALVAFVRDHPDREQLKVMVNRLDGDKEPPLYALLYALFPISDSSDAFTPEILACAQLLLELGASPYFDRFGNSTNTLLTKAIFDAPPALGALLVQHGADTNTVKDSLSRPLVLMPLWTEKIHEINRLSKTKLEFITAMKGSLTDEDYKVYRSSSLKKGA